MSIELADKLYTSTQVADILGVSLRTLYRYMEDSKIQSMRTASGRHRFTKDQILDFLNADQVPTFRSSVSDQSLQGTPVAQAPSQSRESSFTPQTSSSFDVPSQMPGAQQARPATTIEPSDPAHPDFNTEQPSPVTGTGSPNAASVPVQSEKSVHAQPAKPASPWVTQEASVKTVPQQVPVQQSSATVPTPTTPVQPVESASKAPQDSVNIPASASVSEETMPEEVTGIRYYKSDYTDLIELAKRVKEAANLKDLEYAFTLFAGLSLHFLIKPFTQLHLYANPEDIQIWKNELRLTSVSTKTEANIAVLVNTDIVFVPTKEIGGFKVVDDKVLLRDLSEHKEEELLGQFRQHLTNA